MFLDRILKIAGQGFGKKFFWSFFASVGEIFRVCIGVLSMGQFPHHFPQLFCIKYGLVGALVSLSGS